MRSIRVQAGGVLVEVALTLPLLLFTVLGGLTLGYMAYIKVALALTTRQAARDAVIRAEHYLFTPPTMHRPYGYNGVVDTYGLPREKVESVLVALPGDGLPVIHVGSCFRLPATIPDISALGSLFDPPPPTRAEAAIAGSRAASAADSALKSEATPAAVRDRYESAMAEVNRLDREIASYEQALSGIKKDLTAARADATYVLNWAKNMWGTFVTKSIRAKNQDTKLLQTLQKPKPVVHTMAEFEDLARYRCGKQEGGHMIIVRAAYPYSPPPDAGASP